MMAYVPTAWSSRWPIALWLVVLAGEACGRAGLVAVTGDGPETSDSGDAGRGGATTPSPDADVGGDAADRQAGGDAADLRSAGATTSSCSLSPAEPQFDVEPTCSTYRLGTMDFGYPVDLVEETVSGESGNRKVTHRFRSQMSCGYDLVITLPNLKLAMDGQPYDIGKWWSSGVDGTVLVALVLWRGQPSAPALGVASPGSVTELNWLLDPAAPLTVSQAGPSCTDPSQAGKTSQILASGSDPLPCQDEDGGLALRLCQADSSSYRIVAYSGKPSSSALPAVFGLGDLLLPVD